MTFSIHIVLHGGKHVSMTYLCHALQGRSVTGMAVSRSLSSSSCAALLGFRLDLIFMSLRQAISLSRLGRRFVTITHTHTHTHTHKHTHTHTQTHTHTHTLHIQHAYTPQIFSQMYHIHHIHAPYTLHVCTIHLIDIPYIHTKLYT